MHGSSEKSRVRTADGITRATPVAKLLPGGSGAGRSDRQPADPGEEGMRGFKETEFPKDEVPKQSLGTRTKKLGGRG